MSVFWLWREIVLKMRTRFYKKKYWVALLWCASRCEYFIRPNTLLLCIFLFCIFLLYWQIHKLKFKSEYYLRINMWNCVKTQTPAITLWFPEQCLLGFFILEKQLASQNAFLIRSKLFITAYLFLVLYRSTSLLSCFSKMSRPFCASRYWWIIVVFLQSNSLTITIVSQKYRELLQPYSCDRYSKILRTFCASRK